jgi:hypothetical protein
MSRADCSSSPMSLRATTSPQSVTKVLGAAFLPPSEAIGRCYTVNVTSDDSGKRTITVNIPDALRKKKEEEEKKREESEESESE